MGVKRAFRHLSLSIAYTRKSLKNQGWCYAIILASDPQAKLFDGISDGKNFSRDSAARRYRQLICRMSKYAENNGLASVARRRASGFGELFGLCTDSELIRRHGGRVRTRCTPAHRGILGETGMNPIPGTPTALSGRSVA